MKIHNITSIRILQGILSIVNCQLLIAAGLMMFFTTNAYAQDDEEETTLLNTVRSIVSKKKQYDTRTVKGRVTDATTKHGIGGCIVSADGVEGYSSLTNDDGTYELKVPVFTTSIYVVSPDHNPLRIGLKEGEVQNQANLYPISFQPDYSRETNVRNDYTANDFQYSNEVNIKSEVQKQLGAQVYTINRSGMQGVGSVMFMQGLNSLNVNAQPLIVVDDVIYDQQYGRMMLHDGFYNDILSNINTADIEKVTVLRNGTALYGAKGANGVIIIQTRRNKSMATRITANISAGVVMEPKFIDVMGAEQYRNYASEMLKTTNTTRNEFKFLNEDPNYYYYTQYHQNTNWKDQVYHTAITQNYGINVEGGDNIANYNLSVGYTNQQSPLKYNDMGRINVRFNTDIKLLKRLDIRFDASFSNTTRNIRNDGAPEGYEEGTPTSPAFLAYVKSPFLSPFSYGRGLLSSVHYDIDEEEYLSEALAKYDQYNWKLGNPAAINEYGDAENKNHFESSMLNLTVTPKWTFSPHLWLSEHFSYNLVNSNEMYYIPINGTPRYYVSSIAATCDNEVRSLASKQNSVMSDTRLDWNNRFKAHQIHAFAGVRINWESYTMNSQLGYNTGNDKTPFMSENLSHPKDVGANDNWNSMAIYAQAEYNFRNRYFLQGNLTVEGSSRFGRDGGDINVLDAAWGLFPGVQASWVISNEPWLAKVKGINYLRLSAGYDISGNDDIDYYVARSYFRAQTFLRDIAGLTLEGIGNTTIQWEKTGRLNVGLEGHFLNNRLSLTANYFNSTTTNLLMQQSLGFLSGLDKNWTNGGKLKNQGFDIGASIKVLALEDWQWQLGGSIGHYKNEITELTDGLQYIDHDVYGATVRTQVGGVANAFYGYKTQGVFSTTEEATAAGLYILDKNGVDHNNFEAGDIHFQDLDGNKRIDENDRTIIGDPNPDFYGNIFTTVNWKRLKLDVRFTYSKGNDVYNYMRQQLESGSRFMNQTTALLNRWQVEGQQTEIPRITFQDPMGNSRFSDRWIEDGSYLRLKSVTLSYELPLKSQYIQGLQFWVQGNNLLTFTKYLGSDPEFSMTSSVIGQGVDLGLLGQSRSVVAGIKVNL